MRFISCGMVFVLLMVGGSACINESTFECSDSSECGEGTCEVTGFCSFPDIECTIGRRYGEHASEELANRCVDAFAASIAVAEIAPNNIFVGAERIEFTYYLALEIADTDSGVDRVSIQLPPSFADPGVTAILVEGTRASFTDQSVGTEVDILLGEKRQEDVRMQLLFECDAPAAADLIGKDFQSVVDDTATTTPSQSVTEGDADGDADDANRWSVTVSDGLPSVSSALAEISPKDVAIGAKGNLFRYEIDLFIGPGDSGVDELSIAVPAEFKDPVVEGLLVDGNPVGSANSTVDNTIKLALDERVDATATVLVLFRADANENEDTSGVAFRSTVSDSQMPLVAATESSPRASDSWLVTTTVWAAASSLVAEISPNLANVGDSTIFRYDLQIAIGESNTGVDTILLSFPPHLEVTAITALTGSTGDLAYSETIGASAATIALDDTITESTRLSLTLTAHAVACSNDQEGEVLASVDDTSTGFGPQEASPGNADGDTSDANDLSVTSFGSPRLFWTDRESAKIQTGVDSGCAVEDLVVGLTDPRLILADLASRKFYWADVDVGQIWRANFDGSGLGVVVTGLTSPGGIALDSTAGKIYWTDFGTDKIQRANLDGSAREDVLTNGPLPYGIEIDPENAMIYWTDTTDGKVFRAGMDGSNVEMILSGVNQAADIILSGGRLYVSAHSSGMIIRANLDGSGRTNLVSGQSEPVGLAYDLVEDRLYWADSGSGTIRSSNANGGDIRDMISGLSDPQGLVLGR